MNLLLLILLPVFLFGQRTVYGQVIDAYSHKPIAGCYVYIEHSTIGTITSMMGTYELSIPKEYPAHSVLIASFVGYSTSKITIRNEGPHGYNFALHEDALQIDAVVVTARKQIERSQHVPQSITAIGPREIKRNHLFEATDYFPTIPNLNISSSGAGGASFGDGRSSGRNIAIRGVSGTQTTAMYLDETPLPEFADPRLFDIDRIEVLRGPQGTLYGSSAMGGAVKVITEQPNAYLLKWVFDAHSGTVNEGKFNRSAQTVLNLPLIDRTFGIRLGAFYNFKTGVYDRHRQVAFNGFPLNKSDGSKNIAGQVLGENPFQGNPRALQLLETDQKHLAWKEGETRKENVNDETSFGITSSLGIYPTEKISLLPKFIWQKTKGNGYDFADFSANNFIQYRTAGIDEYYTLNFIHSSLTSKLKFNTGELVNSLSYSQIDQVDFEDVSDVQSSGGGGSRFGPPFGVRGGNVFPQAIERLGALNKFVGELRFRSELKQPFNFVAGVFYSTETSEFDAYQERALFLEMIGITDSDLFYQQETRIKTDEQAIFGEVYYSFTPSVQATIGLRYFSSNQKFTQLIGGFVSDFNNETTGNSSSETGLNPKFGISYAIDSDKLLYGSASRGFRLGGANPFVPVMFAGDDLAALGLEEAPSSYRSDHIWTYELGSKNSFANHRAFFNTALFYSHWTNLQQRVFLPSGFLFIDNVGAAEIQGVELEFTGKLTDRMQLSATIGYTDAKISKGSIFTGAKQDDRILNVPKLTLSSTFEYSQSLSEKENIQYSIDITYTGDRVNTFQPETETFLVFDAYSLINTQIAYVSPQYSVSFYMKNMFNTIANYGDITSLASTPFQRTRYATSRPRTIGLSFSFRY